MLYRLVSFLWFLALVGVGLAFFIVPLPDRMSMLLGAVGLLAFRYVVGFRWLRS